MGMILPGYGAPNATLRRWPAAVPKHGHEQRLTGQQALAGADEGAKESALLLRAVAEHRLHLDPIVHVHDAAGFRDGGFVRIELDLDVLHVVAEDLVVDFVHCGHVWVSLLELSVGICDLNVRNAMMHRRAEGCSAPVVAPSTAAAISFQASNRGAGCQIRSLLL